MLKHEYHAFLFACIVLSQANPIAMQVPVPTFW